MPKRTKILVVGQTPPPYGGQAVMIERMLAHAYSDVDLVHVRMAFSSQISDAGTFRVRKLLHLGQVVWQIAKTRATTGATVLYYPPAGPKRVPILRDLVILIATRWMFRKTIFHFHATGLSSIYPELGPVARVLFRAAYFEPDLAIQLSEHNYPDGEVLRARRTAIVPNCIDISPSDGRPEVAEPHQECRLLFVGLVTASKGVEDLLEAGALLHRRGLDFTITLVGEPESDPYREDVAAKADELGIGPLTRFAGVLTGEALESAYREADVFVFPTHGRTESFGIVLLEAMSFGLPLVGSGLGGVRSIIRDELNGFHVSPEDVGALADALEILIRDPEVRARLGESGRRMVQAEYSPEAFFSRMNAEFTRLCAVGRA